MNIERTRRLIGAATGVALAAFLAVGVGYAFGKELSRTSRPVVVTTVASKATPAATPARSTPESRELLERFTDAFESAAAAVNPSVVPIFSEHRVPAVQWVGPGGTGGIPEPFRDLLPRLFGTPDGDLPQQTMRSLGSGVIVSTDGYILTNNHVVQDADKLTVVLNKTRYEAPVIGTDPDTDVAVVKIEAHGLPAATLGNSEDLRVGQWVIAVGNPLEMLHSVTAGIISATGRSSVGLTSYEDFIQTDASINPGNSGGALADLDGRVIGINTAIASPSGGNVGVGFAIPIELARRVMDDLIANGRVSRGYVGLMLQDLNGDLAAALDLPGVEGVLVGDVVADGPAARAGVGRGDVIVSFDGKKIEDGARLRNLVASAAPGTSAQVGVLRNGRERELTVTIGEKPGSRETAASAQAGDQSPHGRLGVTVTELTPDLAARLGLDDARGVLITGVTAGGPAEEAGLRQGDLIQKVAGSAVRSVDELRDALGRLPSGKTVALLIRRGGTTFFAAVSLP